MIDNPTDPPPPPGGSTPPPPPAGGAPPGMPAQQPPPPPRGSGGGSDDSSRKLMLILSYLGILALVPLLTEKDDPEVQWHAKNGLGIFIAAVVAGIVLSMIERVIFREGFLTCATSCIFAILVIGVTLMGMMKALSGEKLRLPVISDFADK